MASPSRVASAAMPDLASSRAQLYSQADSALYAAKRSGRTEVSSFSRRRPARRRQSTVVPARRLRT